MPERVYSAYQRELAVWAAERDGDKATAEAFGCSEATIRSWRHRGERKVTDLRARDDAAGNDEETGGAGSIAAHDLADVQVPTEDWNPSLGCAVKVPARARVAERFELGGQFMSQGERRELRGVASEIASTLAPGDIILLGAERYATFGDALWCVVGREDGALFVRPAKIRRDEKLSESGSRIVAKGPADVPRGYVSPEQRLQWQNEQIDEQERRMRLARDALTRP
jgi:hypothetical protein